MFALILCIKNNISFCAAGGCVSWNSCKNGLKGGRYEPFFVYFFRRSKNTSAVTVVTWHLQRQALQKQGEECHKILMNSSSWAETAVSVADLKSGEEVELICNSWNGLKRNMSPAWNHQLLEWVGLYQKNTTHQFFHSTNLVRLFWPNLDQCRMSLLLGRISRVP